VRGRLERKKGEKKAQAERIAETKTDNTGEARDSGSGVNVERWP
jgi:hypothetical protein